VVAVAAVAAVTDAVVVVAAVIVVAAVVCGLAFDVVTGVFVVAENLCLLWLCGQACIALTCASGFFLLCVVIQFGFCGF